MLRVRSRTEREYATVIVVRKTEKSPSRRREATTTETETAEGGTVATGWGDVTKAMRGGDGTTGEWAHSRSRPLGRHSMREDQRDNDKEDCPHETAETATAGVSARGPHGVLCLRDTCAPALTPARRRRQAGQNMRRRACWIPRRIWSKNADGTKRIRLMRILGRVVHRYRQSAYPIGWTARSLTCLSNIRWASSSMP
jgi:hypothetical protein